MGETNIWKVVQHKFNSFYKWNTFKKKNQKFNSLIVSNEKKLYQPSIHSKIPSVWTKQRIQNQRPMKNCVI